MARKSENDLSHLNEKFELLKRNEEILRSLIQNSFLGIVNVDKHLKVISCNKAFEDLFGYTESEIIGKNLDRLLARHQELEEARKYSRETLAGVSVRGKGVRFRKDDSPVYVEFFAVPTVVDGKLVGAYGLYHDISEREKLARALSESEARYRTLVELSPMAIGVYGLDGTILFANDAAVKLTGAKNVEELLGRKNIDFVHPDSRSLVEARRREIGQGKRLPKVEEKIITLGGEVKHIEVLSIPITYDGNPAILAIFQDITTQIDMRERLVKSEARLNRVFQASPLGIGLVRNRIMQWHNEAMSRLLGYKPKELRGKNARMLYPDEQEYLRSGECIKSLSHEKKIAELDTKWVRKNGEVFDCHLWYSLLDEGFEDPTILAIAEDVSERKKIEKMLQESESRYRQLVEFSPLPITVFDMREIFYANPAARKLFGFTLKENYGGKTIFDFMDKNHINIVRQRVKDILDKEIKPTPSMYKVFDSTGREALIEVHSLPFTYGGKKAVFSIFLDVTEKNKTEERLRAEEKKYRKLYETSKRQEELYRSLLNSSADAIVIYNLEGEVEFLNSSFTRIFGWTLEELQGKHIPFVPESEREASMKVIYRLLQTGDLVHGFETRRYTKNGNVLDISISASRFNDGEDKPAGMLVLLRDITKRKRAEEKLKKEEERYKKLYEASKRQEELYRSLLNSSADAIVIYNLKGEVEFVSPSFTRTFGWTFEDLVGKQIPFVPESEKSPTKEIIERLISTREPVHGFETLRLTKDGRLLNVSVSGSLYLDASKKPVGILVVLRDVTERVQAEKAIRESERRFRDLFDSVSDLIYTQDLEGRFLSANRALSGIFGLAQEEFIGKRASDFMDKRFKRAFKTEYLDSIKKEGFSKGVSAYYAKGGRKIYLEYRSTLVKPENGEPYISGIARDVTERVIAQRRIKKLQEEMLQAQKMEAIGTLAGGIAHDFNNLLMGIQGNVSLLKLKIDAKSTEFERLKNIEEYVQHGSDLTMQLLGFARGGRYEVQPTDMNFLIRREIALFGRTKKEIEIQTKFQDNLWAVQVDQGQIAQVFLNLFVNAWQAMPQGGYLYVQTENVFLNDETLRAKSLSLRSGEYVKISVSDTGVGMSREIMKRIFEPFFTTKQKEKGTGLGLAAAYGIIKNHGGAIEVESEEGQGTTFTIYLPATQKDIKIEKKEVSEDVVSGKGKILFVDDEEGILNVGKQLLETLGYEVLTANSGNEAIKIFRNKKNRFDLVILDMIMPGMGGLEVYEKLKKEDPDIKVLLASGYSLNSQASEIMARGCDGFIQKPFSLEKLSSKVVEVLKTK